MPKHTNSDIPADILAGVLGSFLNGQLRSGGPGFPFGANASFGHETRRPTQTSPVENVLNPVFDFLHKAAGDVQDFLADTAGDEPKKPTEENPSKPAPKQDTPNSSIPPMDIIDYKDKVEFRFAIAGLTRENVNVELEDETLTILIKPPVQNEEGVYIVRSIWTCEPPEGRNDPGYQKSFLIPTRDVTGRRREIDESDIRASVKDGLFTVTVPFKGVQKTKITIQ